MTCLDENTIIAFFAESRESARESGLAARVDAHAADCKACRDMLVAFASLHESPGGAPSVAASAGGSAVNAGFDPLARALAKAHASKRLGTTVGDRWRLDSLLGMGGMAIVFAATHRNGKRVAIKMMRPELAIEPTLVQRFLREAYTANRVAHRGALAVHDDARTDDGVPFLVMELLEGRTLRERLDDAGPLPIDDACRIAIDVLDILASAHDKGIVHRDVKPENLFETTAGVVYVLDFGIARLMESSEALALTHSGVTMGTLGYMPPEQARGNAAQIDARSDLWAVGATLFTLLTGRAVHAAPTHNEALLLAMTAKVARVRVLAPGMPSGVARVLDRALAFDREARWESARAMQAALAATRGSSGEVDGAVAERPRRRLLGTAAAAATAAAIAAFAIYRGAPPPVAAGAPMPSTAIAELPRAPTDPASAPNVPLRAPEIASARFPPAQPPSALPRVSTARPSSTRVITTASSAHLDGPATTIPTSAPVAAPPSPAVSPAAAPTIDPLGPRT